MDAYLFRNLCTNGLKVKVASTFDKLPGHQQTGVVYVWLMLDILINVTPDVAKGLKEQLKLFGEKGLKGCYPGGENVEAMANDVLSICEVLERKGCLPEETLVLFLYWQRRFDWHWPAEFLQDGNRKSQNN